MPKENDTSRTFARVSLREALASSPGAYRAAANTAWGNDTEDYPVKQMREEKLGDGAMRVFKSQVDDLVSSPGHYASGAVEAIDAIRQALGTEGFVAFCQGNVLKYVWRARFKGNLPQDMAKAAWYARMASGDDPRKS